MRLAAQAKGGFYPVHDEVIRAWARLLEPKDRGRTWCGGSPGRRSTWAAHMRKRTTTDR